MKTLTKRQKEILDFIRASLETKGYSPTFREIQHHFHFSSVGSVVGHVKALSEKGYIESDPGRRRSLLPLSPEKPHSSSSEEVELPFVGIIQASFPIEMVPDAKTIKVPSLFVRYPESTYILQVQGDSLESELMKDGDLLIVEARQEAETGELVIGTSPYHETLIRRYFPEGDRVRLETLHPHDAPTFLRHDEFRLLGAISGLLRSYI